MAPALSIMLRAGKKLIAGLVIAILPMALLLPLAQPVYAQPDYDLLIITPLEFESEITPLKDFKNATGRPTVIVTLEDIYANPAYDGADTAEEVKKCIADYETTHNIKYVLLVGDVDKLPMRYFYFKRLDTENVYWLSYYLTDHYYADLYDSGGAFCSWNANANGYYAELVDDDNDGDYDNVDGMDFEFDVAVGRIPASTADEVTTYVNKVIKYEKDMVFGAWFQNILIVTGTGDWIYPDDINQSDTIATKMTAAGFNPIKLYHTNPPGDTYPNPDNINDYLNAGAGFMNVYSHGAPDSWGVYTVPDDMDDLANEEKLTFIYSCGCHTCRVGPRAPAEPYTDTSGTLRDYGATYNFAAPVPLASWIEPPIPDPLQDSATDLQCMPEYWNDSYAKGAVAFIGSTAETAGPNYFYIVQYFWDSIANGTRVLGDAWDEVNGIVIAGHPLETDFEWARRYMHVNIFGDPTLVLGGLVDRPPETALSIDTPKYVDGSDTYVTSSTTFTLTADDDDLPVESTYYRYWLEPPSGPLPSYSTYLGPFTLSGEDGLYAVQYYSEDSGGNTEYPVKEENVILDNTAPKTTLMAGSPSYADTYVKSSTPFTLSADDGSGSGVAETYYKVDSGAYAAYTGEFTLSGEGPHTIYFYSEDNLGNAETEQSRAFVVDDTPPMTDLTPGSPNYVSGPDTYITSATPLTLSADDGSGSGAAETYYKVDSGAYAAYTGEFTLSGEGPHTIYFYSEDNLGNSETEQSRAVIVDDTPPVTTFALDSPGFVSGQDTYVISYASIDVMLSASDTGCGVDYTEYRINGGTWAPYLAPFSISGPDGPYVIDYRSVDNLANTEAIRTKTVILNLRSLLHIFWDEDDLLSDDASPSMRPSQPAASASAVRIVTAFLQPSQVTAGQPVTIMANIRTSGEMQGSYAAELLINGQVESSQMVTVPGNAAVPVKFTVARDKPGTYAVDIGGQKAYFTVVADATRGSGSASTVMYIALGLLALLAAGLGVIYARRRGLPI